MLNRRDSVELRDREDDYERTDGKRDDPTERKILYRRRQMGIACLFVHQKSDVSSWEDVRSMLRKYILCEPKINSDANSRRGWSQWKLNQTSVSTREDSTSRKVLPETPGRLLACLQVHGSTDGLIERGYGARLIIIRQRHEMVGTLFHVELDASIL